MKPDEIVDRLTHRLFGRPIVQNDLRGAVAEEIVAGALEPDWKLCSEGWQAWDLENDGGVRIQVKSSAARQSWSGKPKRDVKSFSIAPAKGRYLGDGCTYIKEPGHYAEIYILAWHPVKDESADQRDPAQWWFYVLGVGELPNTKTISQSVAHKRWSFVSYGGLKAAVDDLVERRAMLAS